MALCPQFTAKGGHVQPEGCGGVSRGGHEPCFGPRPRSMSSAGSLEWAQWRYVRWPGSGEGMSTGGGARGPPRRRWRDLLGGHHQGKRNHDVGRPGPHGALAAGACHQLAQRVGHAAFDPVPDHHPCAKAGGGEERLGRRDRSTHLFILGPVDSRVRTRVTPG